MSGEQLKCDNCGGPLLRSGSELRVACPHCGHVTQFKPPPAPPVSAFGGGAPAVQRVVVVSPGYSPAAMGTYRRYTLLGLLLPVLIWLGSMWFASRQQDSAMQAAAAAQANAAAQAQAEADRARAATTPTTPPPETRPTTTPTAHPTTKTAPRPTGTHR